MALIVAARSERTGAGYGGAVELAPGAARSANRQSVADVLRLMAEAAERGEMDELIGAES